jgi:hypothetical protein
MKNIFKMFLLIVIITLPLSGCFKSPEEKAAEEVADAMEDWGKAMGESFGDMGDMGDMDSEDMAEGMGNLMEFGAKMELAEFEEQSSLDLPKGFPSELVYSDSKITSVSGSSDITLKTTDESEQVMDFYKSLLKDGGDWTVTDESMESGYYSLNADNDDANVDITIYSYDFTSLTEVDINYYSN